MQSLQHMESYHSAFLCGSWPYLCSWVIHTDMFNLHVNLSLQIKCIISDVSSMLNHSQSPLGFINKVVCQRLENHTHAWRIYMTNYMKPLWWEVEGKLTLQKMQPDWLIISHWCCKKSCFTCIKAGVPPSRPHSITPEETPRPGHRNSFIPIDFFPLPLDNCLGPKGNSAGLSSGSRCPIYFLSTQGNHFLTAAFCGITLRPWTDITLLQTNQSSLTSLLLSINACMHFS